LGVVFNTLSNLHVTTGTISNPSETQIATPSNDDFISFVQFKIEEMGPQISSNQRI
jgi:hypothetical protein